MFTCREFQALDENLQSQLLCVDGIHLMERATDNLYVNLYALYNFYVEIFFFKKVDEPFYIKAFDRMSGLEVYMDRINIDHAFERISGL